MEGQTSSGHLAFQGRSLSIQLWINKRIKFGNVDKAGTCYLPTIYITGRWAQGPSVCSFSLSHLEHEPPARETWPQRDMHGASTVPGLNVQGIIWEKQWVWNPMCQQSLRTQRLWSQERGGRDSQRHCKALGTTEDCSAFNGKDQNKYTGRIHIRDAE